MLGHIITCHVTPRNMLCYCRPGDALQPLPMVCTSKTLGQQHAFKEQPCYCARCDQLQVATIATLCSKKIHSSRTPVLKHHLSHCDAVLLQPLCNLQR